MYKIFIFNYLKLFEINVYLYIQEALTGTGNRRE
jgi:hypothetical protein